ncbi:MAG: hypothetical protein M9939_01065 [Mesorhizobium sp.]|nr:hypothetical protein [Mesorhizobium sp.]MCO5159697.1 hypothetical protein [Mesorhizobium sp.]
MRHDGTANLVIGRQRYGEKKALHRGNIPLSGAARLTCGRLDALRSKSNKALIFLG